MAQRVLSTEQAQAAVTNMSSILSGQLNDTLIQLENQGQILSDPNNWDGPLAFTFRQDVWPNCRQALNNTVHALEELQAKVSQINSQIMVAGGNQ